MKRIQSTGLTVKGILLASAMIIAPWSQAQVAENGCWAEFYEFPNYMGASVKIEGPIQLATLNDVKGENWDQRIDSLKTGPKARVKLFENINFKLTLTEMADYPDLMKALGVTEKDIKEEQELIYEPGENTHHLGEVNFHRKPRSLKIECVK